jgi:hypothetical protein
MIIKKADDKSGDISALENLRERQDIPEETRRKIEDELKKIRSGVKGESEAAYEINFKYKDSIRAAVIHDLRIEVDGWTAQIDHLIINSLLHCWVLESKSFSEGVAISEEGEFTAFYNGKPYGVPSPIEQNRKHVKILERLAQTKRVVLPTRLGITIEPKFKSLILISKNARIKRPISRLEGIENIIKADQLDSYIDKKNSDISIIEAPRIISPETLCKFANSLVACHVPLRMDWAARFGVKPLKEPEQEKEKAATGSKGRSCMNCGVEVSSGVAKFCLDQESRFSGLIFCMECQKAFPAI